MNKLWGAACGAITLAPTCSAQAGLSAANLNQMLTPPPAIDTDGYMDERMLDMPDTPASYVCGTFAIKGQADKLAVINLVHGIPYVYVGDYYEAYFQTIKSTQPLDKKCSLQLTGSNGKVALIISATDYQPEFGDCMYKELQLTDGSGKPLYELSRTDGLYLNQMFEP